MFQANLSVQNVMPFHLLEQK